MLTAFMSGFCPISPGLGKQQHICSSYIFDFWINVFWFSAWSVQEYIKKSMSACCFPACFSSFFFSYLLHFQYIPNSEHCLIFHFLAPWTVSWGQYYDMLSCNTPTLSFLHCNSTKLNICFVSSGGERSSRACWTTSKNNTSHTDDTLL